MIYRVSPHVLMDVRACNMHGWSRHIMGYTSISDSIKAAAGSGYHAGMAVYLDPKIIADAPTRRARALAALHAVYDPVWDKCPADKLEEGYTPKNIHRLFDRWMELNPPAAVEWKEVVEVETAFVSRRWAVVGDGYDFILKEVPTSDLVKCDVVELIVRPDAVVVDKFGFYRYLDTKTTGWNVTDASWLRNLRLGLQTQLYADAIVQRFGDKATLAGWINACEIKKLPGSSEAAPRYKQDGTLAKVPPCPTHKKPYAECGVEHMRFVTQECMTNAEQVGWALDEAKRAATDFVKLQRQHAAGADKESVRNIPVQGASNGTCRFCPAAEWCDSSRVVGALSSFLTFDPWPVTTGQREHAA